MHFALVLFRTRRENVFMTGNAHIAAPEFEARPSAPLMRVVLAVALVALLSSVVLAFAVSVARL